MALTTEDKRNDLHALEVSVILMSRPQHVVEKRKALQGQDLQERFHRTPPSEPKPELLTMIHFQKNVTGENVKHQEMAVALSLLSPLTL